MTKEVQKWLVGSKHGSYMMQCPEITDNLTYQWWYCPPYVNQDWDIHIHIHILNSHQPLQGSWLSTLMPFVWSKASALNFQTKTKSFKAFSLSTQLLLNQTTMFSKNLLKLSFFVYYLFLTHTFGMEFNKPKMNQPLISSSFKDGGESYSGGPGGLDTVNYINESAYDPNQEHGNENNLVSKLWVIVSPFKSALPNWWNLYPWPDLSQMPKM